MIFQEELGESVQGIPVILEVDEEAENSPPSQHIPLQITSTPTELNTDSPYGNMYDTTPNGSKRRRAKKSDSFSYRNLNGFN